MCNVDDLDTICNDLQTLESGLRGLAYLLDVAGSHLEMPNGYELKSLVSLIADSAGCSGSYVQGMLEVCQIEKELEEKQEI